MIRFAHTVLSTINIRVYLTFIVFERNEGKFFLRVKLIEEFHKFCESWYDEKFHI